MLGSEINIDCTLGAAGSDAGSNTREETEELPDEVAKAIIIFNNTESTSQEMTEGLLPQEMYVRNIVECISGNEENSID